MELARRGAGVIVNGRRAERLTRLAAEIAALGVQGIAVAGDITEEATRRRLVDSAQQQLGGLDLLVNNAGVGALGPFLDASPERLRRVMEVNFFAAAELTRLAVPLLRQGRTPMVANVSSVLAHRAVPNKSEYCASKFALHGLSDALRAELSTDGIDVLLVSPSTTDSEFFENVLEQRTVSKSVGRPMPAKTVARKAVNAMQRGRHEVILSVPGKMLVWLDRLFPTLADQLIARFGSR